MPDQRFLVSPSAPRRLDQFLRVQLPELSRRELLSLIHSGHVRVNGRLASKGTLVQPGDHIAVDSIPAETGPAADASVSLSIIFEDEHLVAVDKPGGMPSHALRAGEKGTIVSALLARYPELRGVGYRELESGLLHRLDNDTSGVLLAARDQVTFEPLRAAHEQGEFEKRYQALVSGLPALGRVEGYLLADRRKVRVVAEPVSGARAVSCEIVISEPYGAFSLVTVRLSVAARHQVRAQLSALGHPIAGDAIYGGAALPGLRRHFLHASQLTLPYQNKRLQLSAALPEDLQQVLAGLSVSR
jgi:23S rRNA pseudouridine1911/1915/1917 synthase